jgi:acetolactate synthase-1/2/3 large subunit
VSASKTMVAAATPEQIDQVAGILSGASNPIIITEHAGRTDDDRDALIRIAESLSAPVFEFWMPAYHNFPRSHPLYGAGPVEPVLGEGRQAARTPTKGPVSVPRRIRTGRRAVNPCLHPCFLRCCPREHPTEGITS